MAPPPPYSPSRSVVRSQTLSPPSDMPSRRVASYEAPSHQSPRLASDYSAPRTERTASIAPSGHGSWTAEGGMAVIAANGDTAGVLGQRYNVPTDALLRANGLSSAAEFQPGTRVIIPVYNANGGSASRVARVEPVRHEPVVRHDHSSREKLLAKHEIKKDDKIARREAERDAKLARYEKAEREAKEAKIAKMEKAEHEKADREAKLARAEDARQAKRQLAERASGPSMRRPSTSRPSTSRPSSRRPMAARRPWPSSSIARLKPKSPRSRLTARPRKSWPRPRPCTKNR